MTDQLAPVVAFRAVSKTYGSGTARVEALDDVTVDIRPGEFTAVMGPSGSGKSTFMNLAAGLDDPTSGEVWVAGHPLHRWTTTHGPCCGASTSASCSRPSTWCRR